MKKIFYLSLLLIFSSNVLAQNGRIISKKAITDLSSTPIYERITTTENGETIWKDQYKYLDEIDMYWITYESDGLQIGGLMVTPKKSGKYPCIVYNRGGNRNFGSLKVSTAVSRMGRLASEGYVVLASNYRGAGRSEGNDEFGGKDVNDVLNLMEVFENIESADPERIGMFGWSRGGMMTYIALTKSEKIDVAVVGGARSNLTIIDRPGMETNVYSECIPDYANNKEDELKKRSAIFWVDKFPKDVPILLLHGNADWRVKSTNSLQLALEFEKHRIPYRLKIYEGADHSISEFRDDVNEEALQWLDKYLKNGAALPDMEFHGR